MIRNFIKKSGGKLAAVILLSILILAALPAIALGQTENTITLTAPDTSQFPQISAFFWPVNADGEFIQDLQPADISVLENSQTVDINDLQKIEPGIHFVVAVNEGPTLANRYAGKVRFDSIKENLSAWIRSEPAATADDFSLINNDGAIQSGLTDPSQWQSALDNYQPDLLKATPAMSSLTAGIDQAADAGDNITKTKVLLYITPLPEDAQLSGIQDAAKRAGELGVRMFIWLIGPQNYMATQAAMVLQKAATDTGGSFFVFSGAETLPDIAAYLNPLKYVYQLTYTTKIRSSGNFDLAVKVSSGGATIESAKMPFSLDVQSPVPIFLSPPIQVDRAWTKDEKTGALSLGPASTAVHIMIEFPDGHQRTLNASRLFVDGKLVAENTAAPFDVFTWELGEYTASETHLLKVTLEDQLGMTNQTIEIPVKLVIEAKPKTGIQKVIAWFDPLRAALAGLGVIAVIAFGWIVLKRSKLPGRIRMRLDRKKTDPVTQPVAVEQVVTVVRPLKFEQPDWPRVAGGAAAPARLRVCNTDDLQPLPGEGIAITKSETLLGSNARKVDILLSGESVSEVHAMIVKEGEGQYRLEDAGSLAGTWINYVPVPARPAGILTGTTTSGGTLLEHGDLIHIGRIPLRFEIHRSTPRRIQVIPVEEQR